MTVPQDGYASFLQRRSDALAIVPAIVIAESGDNAITRVERCECSNASENLLPFSGRAFRFRRVAAHVIAEQHDKIRAQRIDPPHHSLNSR
jgi:hypothetical protein